LQLVDIFSRGIPNHCGGNNFLAMNEQQGFDRRHRLVWQSRDPAASKLLNDIVDHLMPTTTLAAVNLRSVASISSNHE